MSSLQYQLKSLISSLSSEANKVKDPEIKKRFYLIKAVVESKKDVKKTCEMRGVSTDFFYDWARKFLEARSFLGLQPKSRSPKSFWNKTLPRVERRIIRIRKAEPFKGPERISYDLKKKFKIECPPSTVAAILKRKGLVTKEYRDRLTKKHMNRYRRPWPGYLQMDFKYTPYLLEGRQTYQLSVIDHHSSWRFIRNYEDRTTKTVIGFLDELKSEVPFEIIQIQTDNASEFTDKYTSLKGLRPSNAHAVDVWCWGNGIEHKLIPIGKKELNGKVENTHKWDDREFFSQIQVSSHSQLEVATRDYNRRWNEERPTKTLGWQTPNEVVEEAYIRAIMYLRVVISRSKWQTMQTAYAKITASAADIGKIENPPKDPKKTKKLGSVTRYLQYLDWEERQKLKTLLPVPVILQNFSVKSRRFSIRCQVTRRLSNRLADEKQMAWLA